MANRTATTLQACVDAVSARFQRVPSLFFGHGTSHPADEAAWLVTHAARVPFQQITDVPAMPLTPAILRRVETLVATRIGTRKPLAYLLHEAWLGEHRFYVDERAIVPRSFIAEHLRRSRMPWGGSAPKRILDLCTGSGCLAIVAAHRFPAATVDAVDLSRDALAVAKRNVREHAVMDRVRIVHSDLFAALNAQRYDLILSNPPYVKTRSMKTLPKEYRHEPELALAGGHDGLDLVRRIVADSPRHLTRGGTLVVELGHNRAAFEKAYPRLAVRWLDTSAGDEFVFAWRP